MPSGDTQDEDIRTLDDLLVSDAFQKMFENADETVFRVSASKEDDKTLVILYTYTEEISEDMRGELKERWESGENEDIVNGAKVTQNLVNALVQIDGLRIVFRLADVNGETVGEFVL